MEAGLSIMVVDDSETARTLTSHMLAQGGHRVVEAKDGRDALAQLEAGADVHMILLDLNMPRMTGIQFLEGAQAIVRRIPVFVVTVSGDRLQVERVRELGARGYLIKPIRGPELDSAIGAARAFQERVGSSRPPSLDPSSLRMGTAQPDSGTTPQTDS